MTANPAGPVREITPDHGTPVKLQANCDGVVLRIGDRRAILGPQAREDFARQWMDANRDADAWTAAHAAQDGPKLIISSGTRAMKPASCTRTNPDKPAGRCLDFPRAAARSTSSSEKEDNR